jgi:nucleotide-binding universal stress UspA family protein
MIPPRTILAPVDFSDASRSSLRCAAQLAARWTAALHVLHAIDPLLAAAANAQRVDIEGEILADLLAFVKEVIPDTAPEAQCHAAVGGAPDAIGEVADRLGADLIVAGTRGLTGLNRLVMGTTIEHVIRRTRRSVLTVPGQHPDGRVSTWGPVIAAVEHPADPGEVARAAALLASSFHAPLHLVHVVAPLGATERWRATADAVVQARVEDARRALTAAAATLPPPGPANLHVASGPVADTLAAEVSRYAGAMAFLVLGRAEPGGSPAPGSVAARVIARATAPVWMHVPDGKKASPGRI